MTNVWLGGQSITDELLAPGDLSALSPEAFLIRTYTPPCRDADKGACKQLLIVGGSDRAVLQGVYTFFGEELGVSWLEPGVEYAPKPPEGIREIDIQYHPEFSLREIGLLSLYGAGTREFRYGNRLSPEALCSPGAIDFLDGCVAVPTDAQSVSNRVTLGDEEGAKRLFEEIRTIASASESKEHSIRDTCTWTLGGNTVWLVSAMTHLKPVLSPEGKALNETEESPAAAILYSLNRVVEMLEQAFPNETHVVHVLLSPATQRPPRNLRPHRKVIVQLSTQECDFSKAYSDPDSPANTRFSEILTGWTRLGARIQVLDFLTNQRDPLMPFPCVDVLQENILFFARKSVDGIYYSGTINPSSVNVDLLPLRVFLAARFLFNPDLSLEETKKLFLTGYYGPAAPMMEEYLELLRSALVDSGIVLNINDEGTWLSDEALIAAAALFESVLNTDLPEPYRGRIVSAGSAVNHCRELRTKPGMTL